MTMEVYKLRSTGTADGDAVASLDIQRDGHITGYDMHMYCTAADALNDGFRCEVSFASTNGFASNDTKASICTLQAAQAFLTSGGGPVQDQAVMSGLAIPVAAGERIYVHHGLTGSAGPTVQFTGYLYVMPLDGGETRPDIRRR